ncbi:hypothetical protein E4U54_003583 [Claviceps lovelessii]|nr:hypothetical protein E4U54_003583 [Claviceps lovelessii]
MSQVKNLRAMFENKGDSSPPDRGRSPGVPLSKKQDDGTSQGGSPRPLSKVRTNFVAVEKDGRIGLKREESGDSKTFPRRPCSDAVNNPRDNTHDEENVTTTLQEIAVIATTEFYLLNNTADGTIVSDERAVAESVASDTSGTTMTQPDRERDVIPDDEYMREICSPSQAKETELGQKSKLHTNTHLNTPLSAATVIGHNTEVDAVSSATLCSMINESKITTTALSEGKAFRDESKVATNATGSSVRAKAVSTSSRAPHNRQLFGVRHQTSNNLEHRSKSLTEPVRVSRSVMAPTASSVSKVHDSQLSHRNRPGTKSTMSTSLQSSAKLGSSFVSSNAFAKQPHASTSGPKPSLGPPPSKSLPPRSTTKRLGNIDENFLVRMMRPTRSSASKSADKVSPGPRKGSSQPFAERKDPSPSDRRSTRSVSSRCSSACKPSTTEVADRSPPSTIEGAHVVEVKESSEHTTKDNHECQGTVVDASKTTAPTRASEESPGIILVKDSVDGTSMTNTVRDSSGVEELRDGGKSCRQSCMLDIESISSS